MFDFVHNLTKSAEEKQQELLAAYIDDALAPAERARFEAMLAQDEALAAQMRQQRLIKQRLSVMPRRRVPRTFALDPAIYGKPTPRPLFRLYPALQTATVLAALMLMLLVGLDRFGGVAEQAASEASVAMVEEAETAVLSETTAQDAVPVEEAPAEAADTFAAAEAETANEAAPAEPVQGFAVPAADGEAVPTVASVPRADEAAEELRAAPAETAVPAEEQLTQSTETYAEDTAAAGEETAVEPSAPTTPLRGLQIGLAITFVILLILTLLVRQRVR